MSLSLLLTVSRDVVTEINRNLAATLKACGPALLVEANMVTQVVEILDLILTHSHICQQDDGDDVEEPAVVENSEYDWLIIDTALDVVHGMAVALGPGFSQQWVKFEKSILRFASSTEAYGRSLAVGIIAEGTGCMGSSVTPYTETLLRVLTRRLNDEDPETKSNAAYGLGLLVTNSTKAEVYLPSYPAILAKLEALLQVDEAGHRIYDNVAGCICRMIMAHPDPVAINEYLPLVVEKLPLKDDYDENAPIYRCLYKLCKWIRDRRKANPGFCSRGTDSPAKTSKTIPPSPG